MNEQEVVKLMKSSRSPEEWDNNCDTVKASCGGYPPFWWSAILASGVARETTAKHGETADPKVLTFP